MNEVLKRDNESKLGYFKRITDNRIEYDLDYAEWAELILGEKKYSSDNARKGFYLIKPLLDQLEEESYEETDDSVIDNLRKTKMELFKERKKLQEIRRELNRPLTKEARFELFYENLKSEMERLPLPEFDNTLYISDNASEDIQVITDIHYGANFKSENNEYSTEICKQRFETLLRETVRYIEKEDIGKLNVLSLGDSIQNILRLSDIKINELPVVQAVVEVSRLISTYLNELSKYVYIDYHHAMQSNHSQTRPLGSKASELVYEDLELVIGNYIKDLLANNDRVNVILSDKGYFSMNICGYDMIGLHGHQVRDIKNTIRDYSMLHRKFYQYAFLGHTHAGQSMVVGESDSNNIEILVTPSFVGSDPYSDSLKVGAKAMSKIYKFEEGKGLVQTKNIILN